MDQKAPRLTEAEHGRELLKRELQKGLDSGKSKRTPEQIHAAIRKARAAA